MTGPEPELVLPESAIAPEEILSGSGAPLDSTSASLDIPPLDPLLELPEADLPSVASVASRNAVEPLEALAPEVTAAHDEAVPASSAGQLSSDEEARRLAFEALFNSPEPIPLDDTDSHPAIAAPKDDHSGVFAPDSESEPLNLDRQPEFATPETDPYPLTDVKLEEAEPMSVIGQIPDCAPLLEDAPEKAVWSGTECAPELEEAIVSTSSEVDSPELGDAATPESSPVDAQVEAQRMFTAAYPEAAETFEPAHPALISEIEQPPGIEDESVHPAAEAAPEQPELQQVVSETAPLETLPLETVPVEAQQPASEPSHLESDAAAQMESNAAAQTMPVETVPLETMPLETQQAVPLEAMPLENMPQETQQAAPEPVHPDAEAAAEAMPVLPELETPEPVHLQPETHAAEIASSPEPSLGPNDAERVSQAVDRVFNRFKRLLVAAILRELARPD
jgi:hypothetical protein